jgi:hypothetical protein
MYFIHYVAACIDLVGWCCIVACCCYVMFWPDDMQWVKKFRYTTNCLCTHVYHVS